MFRLIRKIKHRIFWAVVGTAICSMGGLGMLTSCSKEATEPSANVQIELTTESININLTK